MVLLSFDVGEDKAKSLSELRANFKSDDEFAEFLLEAAAFYVERNIEDTLRDHEERLCALEKAKENNTIRTLNGRQVDQKRN
jgi:hypothetical protein